MRVQYKIVVRHFAVRKSYQTVAEMALRVSGTLQIIKHIGFGLNSCRYFFYNFYILDDPDQEAYRAFFSENESALKTLLNNFLSNF